MYFELSLFNKQGIKEPIKILNCPPEADPPRAEKTRFFTSLRYVQNDAYDLSLTVILSVAKNLELYLTGQ